MMNNIDPMFQLLGMPLIFCILQFSHPVLCRLESHLELSGVEWSALERIGMNHYAIHTKYGIQSCTYVRLTNELCYVVRLKRPRVYVALKQDDRPETYKLKALHSTTKD